MVPRQSNHPNVPEQPHEIIDEVLEAHAKGITIAHLHARDSKGNPTHCPDVYAKIVEGIRKGAPDLIICLSLSGRGGIGLEQRAAPIYLKGPHRPDMGSLTLSSLNFTTQASVNSPETIVALAEKMNQLGVIPELEAFDLGMVNYANYLLRKGILSGPIYINLILGISQAHNVTSLISLRSCKIYPIIVFGLLVGSGKLKFRRWQPRSLWVVGFVLVWKITSCFTVDKRPIKNF